MPACCFMRSMREHGPLDLAADGGRHRDPFAVDLAQILDRLVDVAVLLDELGHDVVDRLQVAGMLGSAATSTWR